MSQMKLISTWWKKNTIMQVTNCWTSYPTRFILVNDWGWLSKMVRLLVSLVLWLHTCNYNVTTDSVPSICKAYNVHFAFQPKVRYKTVYIPWGSSPASCQWVCGWGCCEQLKDWPSSTAPLYPWETETQRENGFRSNTGQSAKQPTTNHRYWKSSSIGHMVML